MQCAWLEADPIRIELDGQTFEFRAEYRQLSGGVHALVVVDHVSV
jgi:hypothetical protein